mmetsp:Transcript_59854/g.165553  ORF Transcript_59854/g.165553 Transcript_59854/m.165553 type:complete len:352 (+) Transcript_59854:735-1790(+)
MARARLRHVFLELLKQDLEYLLDDGRRIAAVGAHDEAAELVVGDAALDLVLELRAPVVLARAEEVEGVAHASDEALGVLREHVLHGVALALDAPRGDRGVLRGGHGVAAHHAGAVVLLRAEHRGDGVGAEEVYQVRGAAEGCGLDGGDAAEAEVVELEAHAAGGRPLRVARLLHVLVDGELLEAAVGADRHRVPHLHEKRLEEVGQPEGLLVRVHHCEEHGLVRDDHALWDALDLHGELAAAVLRDVLPALPVEHLLVPEVSLVELSGLLDILHCDDLADHIALQKVLQPEEADAVPTLVVATAALKVAVHVLGARGVLPVVTDLVAVRHQDDVVSPLVLRRHGCDGSLEE